jgi:murein DD-endopeptidase MepM/ murein hydrolase activator NlpD
MHYADQDRVRRHRLRVIRAAALKRKVLARRYPILQGGAFKGRWTRRDWLLASLVATLGMLLAALLPGVSQALQPQTASLPIVHLPLALPSTIADAAHVPAWETTVVQAGQTLGGVLQDAGVPAAIATRLLAQPDLAALVPRLRPGTQLAFLRSADGQVGGLRVDRDASHEVEYTLSGDAIDTRVVEHPLEVRTEVATGEITSSLYAAAMRAGLSPATVTVLTDDVFKYDIDFDQDLQKGDRFSVVYEQGWRDGQRVGSGTVLAATFTTGGKTYSGFRFEDAGKAQYYDASGRPLKKAFIRMPIPFARISSGFSMARKHPILGKIRAHKGIDYAAPMGTPIMAAGDARVVFEGWKGGYGRVVILDHGRGYRTLYAHMSRFGGEHVGQHVNQGAVIGYVGMSGLATGPHLHYEFQVNGHHRNPLSVTMPPPEPLRGAALARFRASVAPALARIQALESGVYARAATVPGNEVASRSAPPRRG